MYFKSLKHVNRGNPSKLTHTQMVCLLAGPE